MTDNYLATHGISICELTVDEAVELRETDLSSNDMTTGAQGLLNSNPWRGSMAWPNRAYVWNGLPSLG